MATILVKKGAGTPSPDDLQEAELALDVVDGALYSKLGDGEIHQLNDGANVDAGVEIGPEPTNPSQGMLWLNDADQTVYIWDEGKWLEFPAGGTGGGEVGTVTTSSVMLEPDARNTLPSDLATQKDVNRYLSGALDKLLDDDGNPIGGGGAEAIEATFYESVQLVPTSTDTGGSTQEYKDVWVVDDNNGEDASTRTNIYSAGAFTARAVDAGTVRSFSCNLDAAGTGLKTPSIVSGRITTAEHTVFGGINIPAADAERPPELPYSEDEKSIQYAFTVTHETMGRTVEIDKEGIIRANQFTDMAGNPIGGGGDPDWAKVDAQGTAIGVGANAEDLGSAYGRSAVATGEGAVGIGEGARATEENSIAIGQGASSGRYGIALGYDTTADDFQFKIYDRIEEVQFGDAELRVRAVSAEDYLDADGFPIMRNVLSLSSMVDAFTTLQTAVADEDTLEGVKTALTNALGGLIEKFEGMQNVK